VNITGQVRYRKAQKKKIMPANCDNKMYYQDMRICTPDNFCRRIKNPVNYAVLKARKSSGTGRQKLTEEQKAMRRAHRERMKAVKKD
jgi:hypothetical protein